MHILISNDDGYMAPGINALANEMRRFGRVSIVAPEHNHSGATRQLHVETRRELEQCAHAQ